MCWRKLATSYLREEDNPDEVIGRKVSKDYLIFSRTPDTFKNIRAEIAVKRAPKPLLIYQKRTVIRLLQAWLTVSDHIWRLSQ